jgi:hypothetical protein
MIKLSRSASMIGKKVGPPPEPVAVARPPDPVRMTRPMRVTTGRPNPVICEKVNKCIWYQAPGILETDYDAICQLATMHYDVNHRRKERATDHIIVMTECPLPRLEAEFPEWRRD